MVIQSNFLETTIDQHDWTFTCGVLIKVPTPFSQYYVYCHLIHKSAPIAKFHQIIRAQFCTKWDPICYLHFILLEFHENYIFLIFSYEFSENHIENNFRPFPKIFYYINGLLFWQLFYYCGNFIKWAQNSVFWVLQLQ